MMRVGALNADSVTIDLDALTAQSEAEDWSQPLAKEEWERRRAAGEITPLSLIPGIPDSVDEAIAEMEHMIRGSVNPEFRREDIYGPRFDAILRVEARVAIQALKGEPLDMDAAVGEDTEALKQLSYDWASGARGTYSQVSSFRDGSHHFPEVPYV